jgi:beta-glucuronidase
MKHLIALMLAACAAFAHAADPVDVQLAGKPVASRADSLTAPLQNIYGRSHLSLNGRWSYIIDPYETGYYDYRHVPFDASSSGKGGFYHPRNPN